MARRLPDVTQRVNAAVGSVDSLLGADPGRWLPAPARRGGLDRWWVTLHAGPLARTVVCRVGPVWRVDRGLWRGVEWMPAPERHEALPVHRWLPALRGELGLRGDEGLAVLVLEGLYEPPPGRIGDTADAAGLHRVATATAVRFLGDVAERLEASVATGTDPTDTASPVVHDPTAGGRLPGGGASAPLMR